MPTWSQLGSQNHPKMEPSWLQKRSKRQSSKIIKIFKNHCFFNINGGFEGPKLEPKSIKIGSRRYLKQDKILDRFWMALELIFGRFWDRFWRPKWLRKWRKLILNVNPKTSKNLKSHFELSGGVREAMLAPFWNPLWD